MHQLKLIIPISTLALVFVFSSCRQEKSKDQAQSQNKDKLVENHVDSIVSPFLKESLIAGTVIGIAKEGKIIFLKSYGFSDIEKKIPMETTAVFPTASVTKTFTAIAIMQLIEKGLINLDDNIEKYLDFSTKDKIVTVRQLLNHTSGIKDYTESDIPNKLQEVGYSTEKFLELLEQKEFDFEPGDARDYNNSGFVLLALIIEKLSGLSYEEYLNKNIFQPVGMTNTSNCYTESIKSKIVEGYNLNKDGKLNPAKLDDLEMSRGAGTVCSTVEDLLKWLNALHRTNKLLDEKGYNAMKTPNKLKKGAFTNYGLGLEINQYKGNNVISHNGIITGYLSDTRYFPESDLTIVTLINTLGKVKPTNVSNAIADYFIEEKSFKKNFDGDLDDLKDIYTGVVMGNQIEMSVIEENGQLVIQSRKKYPIQYIGQNTWLAEDGYTYAFVDKGIQFNAPKMSIILKKKE